MAPVFLMVTGLVLIGNAFSPIDQKPQFIKKLNEKIPSLKAAIAPSEEDDEADEMPPKKYVKIDGQIFEYNPRNVYNVKGVPTYYIPSKMDFVKVETAKTADAAPKKELPVHQMMKDSPYKVYSPSGVRAVIDSARQLQKDSVERIEQLEKMSQ